MIALQYMGSGDFRAASRFIAKHCDKELVVGETYRWEQVKERSLDSHRHYFACINDGWLNLPEHLADTFPSPDHLRKFALIKAGFCDIEHLTFPTNTEAVKACGLLKRMDTYAVCNVEDCLVTIARAHSQAMKWMGRKRFQESKEKVLHVISNLVGADIVANAEKAA